MENLNTILLIDENQAKYHRSFAIVGQTYGFATMPCSDIADGMSILESNKFIGAIVLSSSFLGALGQINQVSPMLPVFILVPGHSDSDIKAAVSALRNGAHNFMARTSFDAPALFQMMQVAISLYRDNMINRRYAQLKEHYLSYYPLYQQMLQVSEMILINLLKGQLMFPPTAERRVKDFPSLYQKLQLKEAIEGSINDPFSRFSDIAGLRLIFYNSDDMQTAGKILQASDDFISSRTGKAVTGDDRSKRYGYRAVHYDVQINPSKRQYLEEYRQLGGVSCEIQFKTIFAHAWSKINHLLAYKQETKPYQLANGFEEKAKSLEVIEQQMNDLCKQYGTNGD